MMCLAMNGGRTMAILAPPETDRAEIERIPMSLEEFEQIPEGPPFYHYIDGEAIKLNLPTGRHQDIELYLTYALKQHVKVHNLGLVYHNIDVRLPTGNWVGPDIVFIAAEHL